MKVKPTIITSLLVVTAFFCLSSQARATPTYLFDSGDSGPSNNGNATVLSWLNGQITDYNTDHLTSLPVAAGGVDATYAAGNDGKTVTIHQSDYDQYSYVVLHWGNGQNHSFSGQNDQAFYIAGQTGDLTFNTDDGNGISFVRVYRDPTPTDGPPNVPEPATVVLLGFALSGFAVYMKFRKE